MLFNADRGRSRQGGSPVRTARKRLSATVRPAVAGSSGSLVQSEWLRS